MKTQKHNHIPMADDPAHNWKAANGGNRALGKHAGFQEPRATGEAAQLPAGKRRIRFDIQNGVGDECAVTLDIPFDVTPRQRAGVAIFRARNVLPDVKPWRCVGHTEI